MYGMVMMMAVASSGDTASFGNRGSSCHGAPAMHASCHGGGLLTKIKEKMSARHSCHGATAAPACCPAPAPSCAAPAPSCAAPAPSCAVAPSCGAPVMMGGCGVVAHSGHVEHGIVMGSVMASDGCAMMGAPIPAPVVISETPKEMPKPAEPKKEEKKEEKKDEKKKES
jgi:hypothetical protein